MFKKKKPLIINLGNVGVIESTISSIESGVNDKFNKNIVIYESVSIKGDEISWGRKIEEIPYTEEETKNLIEIKKIPIVERRYSGFELVEGKSFGSIVT